MIKIQALYIHKLTKIIMISKKKYYVFIAFQVVVPSFECFNNG